MRISTLTLSAALFSLMAVTVQAQAADGKAVFEDNCAGCHGGGGGAPQIGDSEAWQPRIDKGMETLYANAIDGVGGMPAKGGNSDLSDADVKAAVDYLVDQSR